ncbi:Prosaposin [Bagarius yarrelli]|uniref:Prosaposin n=1 Tax=Bagarius yarrelli TaxID=175774 RepID=A0A556V6Y5_BAGYA|nr:Prosaposin [Bagarius yarrelli]
MSAAPAVCLFILICALTSGYGRILRFNSSPIKSSSLSALQVSPQCTFCLFLIKKLEDMLPKERTEESVVKIMEKICDHLPDHYKEQCNELLEKYGKEIIDFLLTSATPQTICMLLHMCLVQDAPVQVPALASECKTCKLLMILSHIHLSQNSTETQMTALLWRTCHLHPNALPGCESFVQSHVPTLVNILSKEEEAVNACQVIEHNQFISL